MESKKYQLNKKDLLKIGKGCLIAGGGAVLVYLLEILPDVNFGELTPVIVAVGAIAINAAIKWIRGKR